MVWDAGPSGNRRTGTENFGVIADDRRFRLLKKRSRRLAITIVASFLGWYFLYILLSVFARGFMAQPTIGHINVALLLGVLQFVSTFFLAWRYTRYSRLRLDPLAAQLRHEADVRQSRQERMMAERRRIENWSQQQQHWGGRL